jgi:hypothetical protein
MRREGSCRDNNKRLLILRSIGCRHFVTRFHDTISMVVGIDGEQRKMDFRIHIDPVSEIMHGHTCHVSVKQRLVTLSHFPTKINAEVTERHNHDACSNKNTLENDVLLMNLYVY